MIKQIFVGIIIGCIIGLFTTSFFLPSGAALIEIFWTKITATSMVTGLFCGIYAYLSKSKLQIFLVSILIGMIVFFLKYLITGHNFDPLTMGAFTGALLGGTLSFIRKIESSLKILKRLKRRRDNGFNDFEY
jgi:DNA integrity scanning protein DisA with diadenylate cyclase activity